MKSSFLLTACLCLTILVNAQESPSPLTFSGYVETYYSYDMSNPDNHLKPGIFYSYNRHNEVNLNLGYLKAAYAADRVRGNLALMAGTYAQYNLSGEQPVMQHVFEANAGVKLSKKSDLWLDMGILPSHIGFESAVGKDCWAATRSLIAETSPYYESGARLSYTSADQKWYLAALALNGWQRISRADGNNSPAFGTQLTYKPDANTTLNWSTFVGNNYPDDISRTRIFNDFYGIFQLTDKFGVTAGCDIGMEQSLINSNTYHTWIVPIMILRVSPTDKVSLAGRYEYYRDENGVIVDTGRPDGFQVSGVSVNIDWKPTDNTLLRLEARSLVSKNAIFIQDNQPSKYNTAVTAVAALAF